MLDTLICNHTCGCKLEIDRLFSCSHFIFCSGTNRKCWYCLMPFSGRKPSARNVCQLYSDTFAVCSSVPTSWARFTPVVVLLLVSWTMSSRHETDVLLYFCFNRPKHQSGANLVWPTTMKFRLMFRWRPCMVRQIR